MKIAKRQFYLCCASSPDVSNDAFTLTFTTGLHRLLRDWGPTTRISPAWRLVPNVENADPAGRESGGANILFISGAAPDWFATHLSRDALALLGNDSIFLTLGVFSIVIISGFEEVTREILDLCAKHGIAYENWHSSEPPETTSTTEIYSGGHIDRVNPTEFELADQRTLTTTSRALFSHASIQADETVGLMALELYALLAVIETRSAGGRFAALSEDCVEIEAMVAELTLGDATSATVEQTQEPGSQAQTDAMRSAYMAPQELLLTLNAALSRLASQALSGTSPILQTECHFWPHSLLGIGVASLALRNVASFITQIVRAAHYSRAFKAVLQAPARCSSEAVVGRKDMPPYLDQRSEAVAELPGLACPESDYETMKDNELAPTPVTFYSGRDGFRNDILTMSVPLPSVSGCNSHQWNLGTITHELSHRIIAGKIEILLRGILARIDAASLTSKADVRAFFAETPTTIQDQAERLLGFTLAILHTEDMDAKEWTERLAAPSSLFRDAKELYSVTIEETLVHIFDFYHLCGGNTKSYVDFIWLSWAVQPRIAQRQDEYIKRTLTALAIKFFEAENWQDLAIGEFRRILQEFPLSDRLTMQPAILEALANEETYRDHLANMRYLLELFHLIFKSDKLATLADFEGYPAPKAGGAEGKSRTRKQYNYSATQGVFLSDNPAVPDTKFTNPLRFLRDYSRSHTPNAAASAWLLHMLAFNYRPEGRAKP